MEGFFAGRIVGDFGDEDVDIVFFEAFEAGEGLGVAQFSIYEECSKSVFDGPLGDFDVEAFFAADEGSEERDGRMGKVLDDGFFNCGDGLLFDGDEAIRAIECAEFGVEEADEIPEFGDGGDGGFHAAL